MRTLMAVVVILTCGCGGDRRPPLRPLELPVLSSASAEVQLQIKKEFASLEAAIARDETPLPELAAAYGTMGKLLAAAEFWDAADICFRNARALAPADMRWPYYMGHVFKSRNDQPQAETAFAEALKLAPQDAPTLVWLAEMHLQQNRPDEAAALLTRAQALRPSSGAVLYGLGRVALARRDYAQAVTHLEAALQRAPDASRVHYPLALAYRGLNQPAKADAHLRLRGEVDLPPDDPLMDELRGLLQNASAYEVRGSQAIEARRWDDAIDNLRKAIAIAPNNAFSRLNLATSYYMAERPDDALEQYREAVRLSPALARAHLGIGVVMAARGDDAAAIGAFEAAVAADAAFTEARFSLANALRRSGRVADALPHYAAVLKSDPAVSQASFGYAMGLVKLGRYREARARLEADTRAFPDQRGFAHALARLLAAAPDDAVRDGARALTIVEALVKAEQSLAVGETMAMALAETGRFDEAAQWQRQVIASAGGERPDVRARLAAQLRDYERGRPAREPWAATDPVHRPQ